MTRLDQTTIDQVIDEALGSEVENPVIRKRALELIDSRTGLRELDKILRQPFHLEKRAA